LSFSLFRLLRRNLWFEDIFFGLKGWIFSLKGWNRPAQGNALGKRVTILYPLVGRVLNVPTRRAE
jgi:hypothetical protein